MSSIFPECDQLKQVCVTLMYCIHYSGVFMLVCVLFLVVNLCAVLSGVHFLQFLDLPLIISLFRITTNALPTFSKNLSHRITDISMLWTRVTDFTKPIESASNRSAHCHLQFQRLSVGVSVSTPFPVPLQFSNKFTSGVLFGLCGHRNYTVPMANHRRYLSLSLVGRRLQ